MILNTAQINELVKEIEDQTDRQKLDLYALAIGVDLPNLAPNDGLKQAALKLIGELQGQVPPKIDQFLERLRVDRNAALRAIANRLLQPSFYSPTGDAHDAILLGTTAFVARDDLRNELRKFTNATPYSTRVLIVRGDQPGGKSYSWEFLRHLASGVGARPLRLGLKGTSYTPRKFLEQVYRLLRMDLSTLPELSDNPQLALIDPLINDFKGQLNLLPIRYWLVIDDLNEASLTKAITETAYAVASAVEEMRPDNLWVALLGYNSPVADVGELRNASLDDAKYPAEDLVAEFLELVSAASPKKLTSERAQEIAKVLFSKYKKIDKVAMMRLTIELEKLGQLLRQGIHP